jgi:hypothetical protein
VLSCGALPSSVPNTTIRDLRLILSLLDDFCLPASARAGICESEPGASATRSQGNARSSCHLTHPGHLSSVRANHRVPGRARVASATRCSALSRRARLRCLGSQATACVARRSQDARGPSRWDESALGSCQRSPPRWRRLAPRSAPRRHALLFHAQRLLWAPSPPSRRSGNRRTPSASHPAFDRRTRRHHASRRVRSTRHRTAILQRGEQSSRAAPGRAQRSESAASALRTACSRLAKQRHCSETGSTEL